MHACCSSRTALSPGRDEHWEEREDAFGDGRIREIVFCNSSMSVRFARTEESYRAMRPNGAVHQSGAFEVSLGEPTCDHDVLE